MPRHHAVAVIPGDGIGVDVIREGRRVLAHLSDVTGSFRLDEEEFDWSAPLDRRHRSTSAMRAFAPAHRRFAAAGVGLNCMVDYPVAVDPALASKGLGHHLDAEMGFAPRLDPAGVHDMTRMLVGFVDHLERGGRERPVQLRRYPFLNGHRLSFRLRRFGQVF